LFGEINKENSGDIIRLNYEVLFDRKMNYLLPDGVQHDSVLLILIDAVPY